ncbi:MAG: hypothetical protein IPK59_06085 [Rhodospirillaceae bacterium]|nr:hypothetical protein [Rhodospirillaceae bacterium]
MSNDNVEFLSLHFARATGRKVRELTNTFETLIEKQRQPDEVRKVVNEPNAKVIDLHQMLIARDRLQDVVLSIRAEIGNVVDNCQREQPVRGGSSS